MLVCEIWVWIARSKLTLSGIPLHAVLACNLAKGVLDNGGQGVVGQMVVVDLSAEVKLSLGLELVVQALSEDNGGGQEDGESRRGAHGDECSREMVRNLMMELLFYQSGL
jgi:hypothetical protein